MLLKQIGGRQKQWKWIYHELPYRLPCGAEVNKNWMPGIPVECCRTVCKDKSDQIIDACHRHNKRGVVNWEPPTEAMR